MDMMAEAEKGSLLSKLLEGQKQAEELTTKKEKEIQKIIC